MLFWSDPKSKKQRIFEAFFCLLAQKIKFEKGISKIYKHNDSYVLVQVKSVLPKAQKTLDESKGLVVSDYQAFKEEEWLKELKKKYKVEVNNEALLLAKNKIKNNK